MRREDGSDQRFLWLTLGDPDPVTNGQYLYSGGLIRAVAAAGVALDVVGSARPEGRHRDGEREDGVHWHLAEHQPRRKWQSLAAPLPHIADQTWTPAMRPWSVWSTDDVGSGARSSGFTLATAPVTSRRS